MRSGKVPLKMPIKKIAPNISALGIPKQLGSRGRADPLVKPRQGGMAEGLVLGIPDPP